MSCRPYPVDAEQNVSYEYTYNTDGLVTQIDMTSNGTVFRRTLTWNTDAQLTDVSVWVKQ